jgi:hypothetical protein
MEFDKIENMWKKQSQIMNSGKDIGSGIIDIVHTMEKKTKRKYLISTVIMCIELLFFTFLLAYFNFFSGLSLAGIILIMFAVIMGIASVWSTNILFTKSDLGNTGIEFLKKILDKLDRRKFLRIYLIPVLLVMIAFGVTLIYLEHLSAIPQIWKTIIYSASYLYIIIIYIVTSRREVRKEKIEIEPIRKKITALIMDIESE